MIRLSRAENTDHDRREEVRQILDTDETNLHTGQIVIQETMTRDGKRKNSVSRARRDEKRRDRHETGRELRKAAREGDTEVESPSRGKLFSLKRHAETTKQRKSSRADTPRVASA